MASRSSGPPSSARSPGRSSTPPRAAEKAPKPPAGDACALTIAGLDPSGGAGLAADLRGFAAADVWGAAVCALVTVQSTAGLRSAHPLPAELVLAQATEVLRHQRILAIKTGALGSPENVRAAVQIGRAHPKLPLIVDPVMIATRTRGGARLLEADALDAMRELAAQATLVTPNVDEAEALLEGRIRDLEDLREAAVTLVGKGARAALVKGGHLVGDSAADVLATRGHVVVLRTPRRKGLPFHGGGCTLAALIAGGLAARGVHDEDTLLEVVRWAKRRLTTAISRPRRIGDGLLVLDPLGGAFPAGAFLAGAFLTGAFLAGAFSAGLFWRGAQGCGQRTGAWVYDAFRPRGGAQAPPSPHPSRLGGVSGTGTIVARRGGGAGRPPGRPELGSLAELRETSDTGLPGGRPAPPLRRSRFTCGEAPDHAGERWTLYPRGGKG